MSTLLDYMRLCRLCLVKDKVNVPIFGGTSDVRQIFLKITACLPVKVSQDDNLPKNICDSCLYKVDLLYQFWNTTVNAEKQLITWLEEIGVDVNIKSSQPPPLQAMPQSHAHPHSITGQETLVLKEERPDSEIKEVSNVYGYDLSYGPQVDMTVGAPQDFTQSDDAPMKQETKPATRTPAKRRGRPPKQKSPAAGGVTITPVVPATSSATPAATTSNSNSKRRSSAAAAAARVAAAVANEESDDSDIDDRLGGDDDSDEDMDVTVAKEEADSEDDDYGDNPEGLEPTAFVGVPSTSADAEQPGPSGLGGGTTTGKIPTTAASTGTESGSTIKLPPGIRITKNANDNTNKKNEGTEKTGTKCLEKAESVYNEFLSKAKHLTNIQIENTDDSKADEKIEDMSNIVDSLTKCGLIVRKISKDENLPNDSKNTETVTKVLNDDPDVTDDSNNPSESLDESEYEIETLDDDESDLEYVPEIKKLREGKRTKECVKKVASKPSKQKKSTDFMKIISTNYMCVMCQEKFPSLDLLTAHMRNPTPCKVLVVKCPICEKEFPNKSRCSAHMYSHKEKEKFSCDKCTKQFSTQISLQMHSEFSHTEHFDSSENGWKCKYCEYCSESRITCVYHVNSKHLHLNAMLCDICGKSFVRESSLRAHMMIHTEARSYLCEICEKGFKMKSSLRAHIKTHNLEKRFICDECGKSFKKNCSLSEHKKHHAGDYSFSCLVCEKRFVSKSLLNTHMKNHIA